MTIVGQNTGTLTGPGSSATTQTGTIKVTGGDLYIRDLSVTAGSPGIWATVGAILRLDHVSVSGNTKGGILLDGAGFDIQNTTVNNNGGNTYGSAFGGILIQNPPTSSTIPKTLSLTTIDNNQLVGISCPAALTPAPTTVLASGNLGGDIGDGCGFQSCDTASTTCGAQP
jgi:hypothetical protein